MIIRDAEPEDAGAVAIVHVRSWQAAYRGLLADDYLDGLQPSARAARDSLGLRRRGDQSTIVIVDEEDVRGFATMGPSRDADAARAGELYALYLDPDAWGQGLGRALIADARARLHRHGYTEAILWVLAGNRRARRFYGADGWEPDGLARQEELSGAAVNEVRYRRALP